MHNSKQNQNFIYMCKTNSGAEPQQPIPQAMNCSG